MKIKLLFLTLILSLSSGHLLAQDQMFRKLSEDKNISTIIISKTLLSMASNVDMGGIDSNKLFEKLDNIEIYSSENKKSFKKIKKEADKIKKDRAYEILVKAQKKGKDFSVFGKKGSGDIFSDIIIPLEEGSKYTIVRMLGSFTMEDIQNATDNI